MLYVDHYYEFLNSNNPYPNDLPCDYPDIFDRLYTQFLNIYDNLLTDIFSDKNEFERLLNTNNDKFTLMIPEGIYCKYEGISIDSLLGPFRYKNFRVFVFDDDTIINGSVSINKSFSKATEKINKMISIFINKSKMDKEIYRKSFLSTIVLKYMDLCLEDICKMHVSSDDVIILNKNHNSYYILYLYIKTYFKIMNSITNMNQKEIIKLLSDNYDYTWDPDDKSGAAIKIYNTIFKYSKRDTTEIEFEESDTELLGVCALMKEVGYCWRYKTDA